MGLAVSNTGSTKMGTQCKFMAHLQAAGREGGRAGGETEMGGEGEGEDHEECKG